MPIPGSNTGKGWQGFRDSVCNGGDHINFAERSTSFFKYMFHSPQFIKSIKC